MGSKKMLLTSLVFCSVSLLSCGVAFADTTTSPNVVGTNGGQWIYGSLHTYETNVFIEKSHSPVLWNDTASSVPYTWSGDITVSNSASASATLSAGWGPVNVAVGLNADTSVSQTWTYEATCTIPAYEYGWYRFGYAQDKWYGDYYYLTDTGAQQNSTWIYTYSPRYTEFSPETSATPPSNP